MSSKTNEADMPPFPGRAIKFGTFNVTSQASTPSHPALYHYPLTPLIR